MYAVYKNIYLDKGLDIMYAVYKNIYLDKGTELLCFDIKYRKTRTINLNSSRYYSHNNDYIFFQNTEIKKNAEVDTDFGEHVSPNFVIQDNNSSSISNIWYIYGKNEMQICKEGCETINILKNHIFFDSSWGLSAAKLYDLTTGSWTEIYPNEGLCQQVFQLKNGIILSIYEEEVSIHETLEKFIIWLTGELDIVGIEIPWLFSVGDNEIIGAEKHNAYIHEIVVYDLNCYEKYRVDISQYMIRDPNIAIADVIYFWDGETILIINNGNVIVIENKYHVKVYSHYYKVFVNSELLTFRIVNCCLVPFVFTYDFWYDDDKPEYVNNIIDVLIELDLFPIELCNLVYPHLII